MKRTFSISTRTLLLSFSCMCAVLVVGFLTLNVAIRATIRDGLRENLHRTQEQIDQAEDESNRRNTELIAILSEDTGLKAAIGLLRELPGLEARKTIEDQLHVMSEGLDFALLMVLDAEGKVAATEGVDVDVTALDVSSFVFGKPALVRIGNALYEVTTVPINMGTENLGRLAVGQKFSLDAPGRFGYAALLDRNEVVVSNLPENLKGPAEHQLSETQNLSGNGSEIRIGPETFLVLRMNRAGLGDDYQLLRLAPISESMRGFTNGLRNAFAVTGVGVLLIAFALSVFTSRAIARPLADLASRLEISGDTGALWDEFRLDSSTREVNLLAGALNHAATTRRQVEADLNKAKDEAEAANRAKSEFLNNISHELRTPMNGILGMTDLVLETSLEPEQRADLELVKTSAKALLITITEILDFSELEDGTLELRAVEFPLDESLREAIGPLAAQAQQKGLALTLELGPKVPARAVGDPERLHQILSNLVDNAIKFTERGQITIRVEPEPPGHDRGLLRFTVKDTGAGVPDEKLGAIFEAFSQADSSATRKHGGTGLGLTIAARLVEMMQGRIWVESEVGSGATFHFTARLGAPSTWVDEPGRSTSSVVDRRLARETVTV